MSGRCHHQACAHTHAVPRGRYLLEHRQQHGELVAVCGRIPRLSRPGREVVRGRQGALLRALQATGHTERLPDGAECAVVYTGTDPLTRREQHLKSGRVGTDELERIELGRCITSRLRLVITTPDLVSWRGEGRSTVNVELPSRSSRGAGGSQSSSAGDVLGGEADGNGALADRRGDSFD